MTTKTLANLGLLAALALSGAVACDGVEEGGVMTFRGGGQGGGGPRLNSDQVLVQDLGAVDISLTTTNGPRIVSAKVLDQGVFVDLDALEVTDDGELQGSVDGQGQPYAGEDFYGAEFALSSGLELRITGYSYHPIETGDMAHHYGFQARTAPGLQTSLWENFCTEDDLSNSALLMKDVNVDPLSAGVTWKPHSMLITCQAGAAGHLLRWGYTPQEHSLAEFEAAIAAVRADYCKDNDPQTLEGTEFYMTWGVDQGQPQPGVLEAHWGLDGALCIKTSRFSKATVNCDIPTCAESTHNPADELFTTSSIQNAVTVK